MIFSLKEYGFAQLSSITTSNGMRIHSPVILCFNILRRLPRFAFDSGDFGTPFHLFDTLGVYYCVNKVIS